MVESLAIWVESAWFQLLKLKYDKLLISFAFDFQLAPARLQTGLGIELALYTSLAKINKS